MPIIPSINFGYRAKLAVRAEDQVASGRLEARLAGVSIIVREGHLLYVRLPFILMLVSTVKKSFERTPTRSVKTPFDDPS